MQTRKWTCLEYEKLVEVGVLGPDERVELIQGDILTMAPVDPLHANAVGQSTGALVGLFGSTHNVRVQVPLLIGSNSEPEPDFCFITLDEARRLTKQRLHPSTAELVIELSNTSLTYDRGPKASLYASGKIPQYWIVDLKGEALEVYRDPVPDPTAHAGWSYASFHRFARNQIVEFAGQKLTVDLFLPPLED